MQLTLYKIDTFTDKMLSGNPAAVIPLEKWLPDETMNSIAEENSLSETAFFIPADRGYHLRWFTPNSEVSLGGHSTLATAFVIFEYLGFEGDEIRFISKTGPLYVLKHNDVLTLDFPSQPGSRCALPDSLLSGLKQEPVEVLASQDYMAVFSKESDILALNPDFDELKKLDKRGVIVTAPGTNVDYVSRFFSPKYGIDEDPATGSSHCQLVPYWGRRLEKEKLTSRQLSKRGGEFWLEQDRSRVLISGKAVRFMKAEIELDI